MTNTRIKIKQAAWDLGDVIAAPEGKPLQRITKELEVAVSAIEAMRPKLNEDISSTESIMCLGIRNRSRKMLLDTFSCVFFLVKKRHLKFV